MLHLVGFVSIADIGDSLREAFFMFWETLWALVLGFTLSGAVQAFVSKDDMQRVLGDHGPKAVARASGFGMVSSSCSYAATAMAKSLFQKGADFVSAMVFMFASTNLVAGFMAVLVAVGIWNDVFLHGHGFWTSLENVIVGPFIAVISFVCSIGNVPMAAALWHGGISFGGVISFIFADLIALPLLLIYRKYYGTALTVRLFVVFYAVMAAAGLVVEGLFALFGAISH